MDETPEEGARRALVAIGMFDPTNEAARLVIEEGVPALSPEEVAVGDEAPLEESVEAVPTPSLAELYVSQGHLDKAIEVYRQLLEEEPDNERYREKISELEGQTGEKEGVKAGVSDETALKTLEEDICLVFSTHQNEAPCRWKGTRLQSLP